MKHILFATAAVALLLAGCDRPAGTAADRPVDTADAAATDTPAPDAVALPEDAAAAPTAGTDAIDVVDHGSPTGDAEFDAKALAGTFAAEGTTLAIAADGSYTLTVHAESADADLTSHGTWTAQAGGREILLDPQDKSEPDRRFELASNDRLRALEGGQVLDRAR